MSPAGGAGPAGPDRLKSELGELLAKRIPLSAAMGAVVEEASGGRLRLAFPLEPNLNRQGTAFGGSLYAAAVLSGWCLLWCVLREKRLSADIVIASSGERFIRPAAGAFTAECAVPRGAFDQGLRTLRRRGLARVDLESEILCQGKVCALFRGTYALIRKNANRTAGYPIPDDPFGV